MATAYKYASADRPLNVVILSDGLTEQQERQTLLQQIQSRPGNARVFCIGVGNDVNRPLLEQLAEDSGGLAAFMSPGDNFARQARAFRQKLMRPFATGLELKFAGVDVTELEPATVPNLYHGAPVQALWPLPGRRAWRKLRCAAASRALKSNRPRNWSSPRPIRPIPRSTGCGPGTGSDRLLKDADRKGDRSAVVPEIVRLGEDFSIVTEYTSFLVLENDAEYQRWKITRRNLESTGRDRQVHAKRREQLDSIRNKALADLGPQATAPAREKSPVQMASAAQAVNRPASAPAAQPRPTIRASPKLGHPHPRHRFQPGWPARRPGGSLAGAAQE